ncbi:signal-transducing adaptor protein 1-like isoform X2 [Myxocyprinus asiaticus]|uniref:signal-transducing adaptor protein 1-like isoform X2 n=1 Tax=Myxocyprinus asiaticus TaxID=70543 RepID=UPI00222367F4|nr:signal-transducing adaptor protein 1-like isoform X2 [Myxocyprinus asiaticus]
MATTKHHGRARPQLPACYHEGFLEKKSIKDKMGRKLWTSLCGNSLFFFNNTKDNVYIEKLELSDLVSVTDDCCHDRNLENARFTLHMKNEDIKMIAPSLESRELWKGFILSVSKLSVPSCLNLLPGQIHMMKEIIEKEKKRQQPPTAPSLLHNIYLPVLPDMPACYHDVSRVQAELLLERNANRGNLLLRPGRDGASFAVTTRQDVNGSVFKHYRVSRKHEGGFTIDVETPISCPTLHDVITCLVEKTNGVLEPFLLEQHYEDNISYVQANEENGERSVQCASSEPLPSPPVPPPKPVQRDYRANSEPLANTQENIYLNEPKVIEEEVNPSCAGPPVQPCPSVRFLPHQNLMLPDQNTCSGSERKALKLPGYPLAALRSYSMSDVPENNSQHGPQPACITLSEELKMIFKKKQALQE